LAQEADAVLIKGSWRLSPRLRGVFSSERLRLRSDMERVLREHPATLIPQRVIALD
jgi:hypothetical protein